jgi:exopolysaccharide biosynthesis predicted pyruvyltransferase EpsI
MVADFLKKQFDILAKEIKNTFSWEYVYFKNIWNAGDELIYAGTKKFFSEYGIPYKDCSINFTTKNKEFINKLLVIWGLLRCFLYRLNSPYIIYWGGGGFCSYYWHSFKFMRFFYLLRFKVIILPSSYPVTPLFQSKFQYWSRDEYESLSRLQVKRFCHDMGIYYFLWEEIGSEQGERKILFSMRTDLESLHRIPIQKNNQDISLLVDRHDDFIKHIDQYSTIYTDRLHIAIAGTMMNKEIYLYPNAYFKNKAIYKTSLHYFKNCHFLSNS